MALGGSITQGVRSSDLNGYGKSPFKMFQSCGCGIRMVRSRKTGSMETNDYEGFRIDEIEEKAKNSVTKFKPSIIMVNADFNDCLRSF